MSCHLNVKSGNMACCWWTCCKQKPKPKCTCKHTIQSGGSENLCLSDLSHPGENFPLEFSGFVFFFFCFSFCFAAHSCIAKSSSVFCPKREKWEKSDMCLRCEVKSAAGGWRSWRWNVKYEQVGVRGRRRGWGWGFLPLSIISIFIFHLPRNGPASTYRRPRLNLFRVSSIFQTIFLPAVGWRFISSNLSIIWFGPILLLFGVFFFPFFPLAWSLGKSAQAWLSELLCRSFSRLFFSSPIAVLWGSSHSSCMCRHTRSSRHRRRFIVIIIIIGKRQQQQQIPSNIVYVSNKNPSLSF